MAKFNKGDKIRCVDLSVAEEWMPIPPFELGEIYTSMGKDESNSKYAPEHTFIKERPYDYGFPGARHERPKYCSAFAHRFEFVRKPTQWERFRLRSTPVFTKRT